jgi:hypothetical protein
MIVSGGHVLRIYCKMGESYLCRTEEILIELSFRIRERRAGYAKLMRTEQVKKQCPGHTGLGTYR